jgi:hypothetical protein
MLTTGSPLRPAFSRGHLPRRLQWLLAGIFRRTPIFALFRFHNNRFLIIIFFSCAIRLHHRQNAAPVRFDGHDSFRLPHDHPARGAVSPSSLYVPTSSGRPVARVSPALRGPVGPNGGQSRDQPDQTTARLHRSAGCLVDIGSNADQTDCRIVGQVVDRAAAVGLNVGFRPEWGVGRK